MVLQLPVHRIIPFSNVEGMGNRTSIFVQGCNANCHYCHNPETIPMKSDNVKNYTVSELVSLIKKHKAFIKGVTVSGGEATLHHKFLVGLFEALHEEGLTCYIDTNGFFDLEGIADLIHVTDKFLFDIKGHGQGLNQLCFSDFLYEGSKLVEGHEIKFTQNEKHFENLNALLEKDKVEEVRFVYVKGYFDEQVLVKKIASSLENYPEVLFKLIGVHARGLPKYRALNLKGKIPNKAEVDELAAFARAQGIKKSMTIY